MLAKRSAPVTVHHDPLAFVRRMSSELDRMFDEWPFFRLHSRDARATDDPSWSPRIDVFEKDNRLVTRVDLPGVKREDVSVEVTDGHLALSGTRKEEKLFTHKEYEKVKKLRQMLFSVKPVEAMEALVKRLSRYTYNDEFLDEL